MFGIDFILNFYSLTKTYSKNSFPWVLWKLRHSQEEFVFNLAHFSGSVLIEGYSHLKSNN